MEKLVLPHCGKNNVTEEMKNGAFHHDSYLLGWNHAIKECIHYLKQQGYRIEEEEE